jgi:hypothetical protein
VSLLTLVGAPSVAADPITGTPEDDVLTGTPRRDTIRALAGHDDITGRRGDDRLFGEEGIDTFHWRNGDGHDRINGGPQDEGSFADQLVIEAGRHLRLHLDALGAGPETLARGDLQVIGIKGIEEIGVVGTDRGDRLVLSSDQNILPRDTGFPRLSVGTSLGNDHIDARELLVDAAISPGPGDDEIRLGKGSNEIFYAVADSGGPPLDQGHDTIFGFGDDDTIGLGEPHPFSSSDYLDTNGDGKLTAKDRTVRVGNGSIRPKRTAAASA